MATDSALASADSIVTTAFLGTWIVGFVISYLAFYRSKNPAFKRALYPSFVNLFGILFVVFSTTSVVIESPHWYTLVGLLAIELPAVSLVIYLNIRFTKFCEACGATQVDMYWLIGGAKAYCSACEAPLKHKPTARLKHKPSGTANDLD